MGKCHKGTKNCENTSGICCRAQLWPSCDVGNDFVDRLNQDVIEKLCVKLTMLTMHSSKSLLLHVVTNEHPVRAMRP